MFQYFAYIGAFKLFFRLHFFAKIDVKNYLGGSSDWWSAESQVCNLQWGLKLHRTQRQRHGPAKSISLVEKRLLVCLLSSNRQCDTTESFTLKPSTYIRHTVYFLRAASAYRWSFVFLNQTQKCLLMVVIHAEQFYILYVTWQYVAMISSPGWNLLVFSGQVWRGLIKLNVSWCDFEKKSSHVI